VVGYSGNLEYVISPRSSIKPLQALPFLESGAFDALGLSEKFLVLACASHKAEKHQMDALKEWLVLIHKTESILRCGPAEKATSLLTHNCSGKHLGMVSNAMHMKMDPTNYDLYDHPYQQFLRKYLTEITGVDFFKAPHSIDGCCIPTYGLTIQKFAQAMSLFVSDDMKDPRRRHCLRIVEAIKKFPEYLSGQDDFVHKVIKYSQGRAIVKTGAEGCYIGIMPEKGLVFALKVVDGQTRAAEVAALHILNKYGALNASDIEKLKELSEPPVLNSRNEKVGVIRVKPM
jgi:L-asparaginase II